MITLRTYTEELEIAQALIRRDEKTTRLFFYRQCYPLFKSIYDNYHTGCESCVEFMNEIYLLILTPSKQTNKCQLENYRGESTLTSWLKTVCHFYCYDKYERKRRMPILDVQSHSNDENDDASDRIIENASSVNIDNASLAIHDLEIILGMMSNNRYREIIRIRYLENKSNEETAALLGMTMANYYNKHKLAKAQFIEAYRKEAM